MEPFVFNPSAYGPVFAPLLDAGRLNELGPGTPVREMRERLESLDLDRAFASQPIRDRLMAQACLAGLWLLYDFLDDSHTISQEIRSNTGSYWHGIMHRREPDAGNAAYWFRRVGDHPVLSRLSEKATALDFEYRNPFTFIDFVERVRDSGTPEEELARKLQRLEWQLLFDHSFRGTISASAHSID
jgi:hypothetical protein